MFDRAAIIRAAWAGYRGQVADAAKAAVALGVVRDGRFKPRLFASYLKSEWRHAKGRAALEAMVATEPAITPRAREIRAALLVMDLTDAPIDHDRYRDLNIELMRIAATGEAPTSHA